MKCIRLIVTAALLASLAGCATSHTVDIFTPPPAPIHSTYFPAIVELPFPTSTLAPINTISDFDDYNPGYIPPQDSVPTTESDPVGMRVMLPADGPGADAGVPGYVGIIPPLQPPYYVVQPVYIETPPTIIIQPEYIPFYQPPFFFGSGGDRDHRRPGGDRNPSSGNGNRIPANFSSLTMPAPPPRVSNSVLTPPAANLTSAGNPSQGRAAMLAPRIAAPLPNIAAPAAPSMSTRLPAPDPRPSFAAPPVQLSVPSAPPPMPIVRAGPPAISAPPPSPPPPQPQSVAPPPVVHSEPSSNSVQPAGRGR